METGTRNLLNTGKKRTTRIKSLRDTHKIEVLPGQRCIIFKQLKNQKKKSSTFQGPEPNERAFEDNYNNSTPFPDCANHDSS